MNSLYIKMYLPIFEDIGMVPFLWVFFLGILKGALQFYFLPKINSACGDSGQLVTSVYPFTLFNSRVCTCISQ